MGATRVAGDDSLRLPWMRMGRGVVWLHASRCNGTGVFVWWSLIPCYEGLRLPWMRMGRGVVWLHASRYNGTGVFVAFVIGDQILMRAKPLCILVHVVVPVFYTCTLVNICVNIFCTRFFDTHQTFT